MKSESHGLTYISTLRKGERMKSKAHGLTCISTLRKSERSKSKAHGIIYILIFRKLEGELQNPQAHRATHTQALQRKGFLSQKALLAITEARKGNK
jgi:hypothetical protein